MSLISDTLYMCPPCKVDLPVPIVVLFEHTTEEFQFLDFSGCTWL